MKNVENMQHFKPDIIHNRLIVMLIRFINSWNYELRTRNRHGLQVDFLTKVG